MTRRKPKPPETLAGTTPIGMIVGPGHFLTAEECLEGVLPAVEATGAYLKTYLPIAGDTATSYRNEPNRANWVGYQLAKEMSQRLGDLLFERVGVVGDPSCREMMLGNLSEAQNIAVIGVWLVADKLLAWFALSPPSPGRGSKSIPSLPAELLSQFEDAAARLRSVLPQSTAAASDDPAPPKPRYDPGNCPRCGEKMRVRRSSRDRRYEWCRCGYSRSTKRSTSS